MDTPEIRWAMRGELHMAYYTAGEGPPDIVYCPNWTNNIELFWEQGPFGTIIKQLARIGRVITFDQPGTGISDPVAVDELPPMEQWMEDVAIVMDAAGSERAALVAIGAGSALACLVAASHPERVSALVVIGGFARLMRDDDYPIGYPNHTRERGIRNWLEVWGTGRQLRLTAPSVANDEREIQRMGRAERHSASPGVARAYFELITDLDVRHVLPAIRVPTLVIHRAGDRWIDVDHGRYLAEHIPQAKFVVVPGDDHFFMYRDTEVVMAEIRGFLTGARPHSEDTRILATVVFTDIVDSTRRAAELGDQRWREMLAAHNDVVRVLLEQFRGREIMTTGDGFLATFDGPARGVRCARAILEETHRLGLQLRIGVHSGEVEVLGLSDIGGIALHIGARVMSEAEAGEILVSSSVPPLVLGSGISFEDKGERQLKGITEPWRLYAVRG